MKGNKEITLALYNGIHHIYISTFTKCRTVFLQGVKVDILPTEKSYSLKLALKKNIGLGDMALILVNLVPIWGVWFHGWNVRQVFIVYCLESIIVGLYNIVQLWFVLMNKGKKEYSYSSLQAPMIALFFILFFMVHFGLFIFVQMTIFLAFSAGMSHQSPTVWQLLTNLPSYLDSYALLLLLSFAIAHAIGIIKDFFIGWQYRNIGVMQQMFYPYKRVFVQQFAVIFGSFFLLFGAGKVFILLFVAFKVAFSNFVDYTLKDDSTKLS